MPGERRRELWTNREVILSSDLTRVGKLVNLETQNAEKLRSVRADFYDPATNTGDDFAASMKALAGPAHGLLRAPSIDPVAGTFNVTLGAGEGEVVGSGTIPADESEYQLARWAQQVLTWPVAGQPNSTNPRICLITATPADESGELQSRNILANPDTRETSPANVYKLSSPVATITVIPGDANAAPVPPLCPAGSLPLFEVIVPAGATDSTLYQFVRRSWRRIEFPGTSQHGIVKNCVPNLVASAAEVGLPALGPLGENLVHRIVINGELLTWTTDYHLPIVSDLYAPPTAAPAGSDRPTYLYLCGGSSTPLRYQGRYVSAPTGPWAPVVLVESLTPPDPMGYPRGYLQIQWGAVAIEISRAAACFIGNRWLAAGGTDNVPVVYDGDWAKAAVSTSMTEKTITAASADWTSFTFPEVPSTSTVMRLRFGFTGSNSTTVQIGISDGATTLSVATVVPAGVWEGDTKAVATAYHKGLVSGDTLRIIVRGVNMNIPRLSM